MKILVDESKKNFQWFFNDLEKFQNFKKENKNEKLICHHCKFIGPKNFFKKCSS